MVIYGHRRLNDTSGRRGEFVSESEAPGIQTVTPGTGRREFGVDDGYRLRWRFTGDDEFVVEAVHRREGAFAGFEGYEADPRNGASRDHDGFGLVPVACEEGTDE